MKAFALLVIVGTAAQRLTERDALLALYAASGGAHWRQHRGWLGTVDPCAWHGVECANAAVTSVDLGGNGVAGTLPTEIGVLSRLAVLNIDESSLSGTLPTQIARLTRLDTLLLASNRLLSGTLPRSTLRHVSQLRVLDLSGTRISGSLAPAVGRILQLRRLQLDHTHLSGTLPTQLGRLGALEALFGHRSPRLSGTLPTELGRLTALVHGLSFASTRLSGTIPSELGRATRLRALWLVRTVLSGTLPRAMASLAALRQLELHANRLSGTLPTQLGALRPTLRNCVLTAAQGPHQPRHSMRPVDAPQPDTNRFSCPLPPNLPPPCVPHLACTAVRALNLTLAPGTGGTMARRVARRGARGGQWAGRRARERAKEAAQVSAARRLRRAADS